LLTYYYIHNDLWSLSTASKVSLLLNTKTKSVILNTKPLEEIKLSLTYTQATVKIRDLKFQLRIELEYYKVMLLVTVGFE